MQRSSRKANEQSPLELADVISSTQFSGDVLHARKLGELEKGQARTRHAQSVSSNQL